MMRSLNSFGVGSLVALVLWTTSLAGAERVFPVPEWQTATPESQGMSAERVKKVGAWLEQAGSKTGLLVRHGRIVGEWYFDDARPESKYLVYSTTKSVSSTLTGMAIEQGQLTLDARVGQFVSPIAPEAKREVSVRQLLSMTSGVHNNGGIVQNERQFTYAVSEAPQDFPPGTKWDYNNTGLALLTPLFKEATGQSLDAYARERLFRPLGIDDAAWSWDQREGQPLSYSGLRITARGLARFGLLHLNAGQWQDKTLISAAWVQRAAGPSQDLNPSYGYLWWNNTTGKWPGVPADAYASLGRFDNSMLIVPSLDLIVLRQVGDDSANNRKLQIGELFRLACEAVER